MRLFLPMAAGSTAPGASVDIQPRHELIDLTGDETSNSSSFCRAYPPIDHYPHRVIDLTNSPSPPPPLPVLSLGLRPVKPDDPPKTPVCIGQLQVNGLVLYPVQYLLPRNPSLEYEWAAVRLHYEHHPNRVSTSSETIHIRAPAERTPTGNVILGETFGVVEQRVATHLGVMLSKGLIRLEAKIRRGNPSVRAFFGVAVHACSAHVDPPAACHPDASPHIHTKGEHRSCRQLSTPVQFAVGSPDATFRSRLPPQFISILQSP